MRGIGMSTRAIASATGISQKTASRELAAARESNDSPVPVTGTDGKTYTPRPQPQPEPERTGTP